MKLFVDNFSSVGTQVGLLATPLLVICAVVEVISAATCVGRRRC